MRAVTHDESQRRYELRDDSAGPVIAFADYRRDGDVWEFHHTVTEPEHRGQGLAAEVVRAALDDVRANGGRVVPTCWYVDGFMRNHVEYADLRAERD
ncbi:MAG: N-acetyltransferase [Acidimicrobiia bacterium]|nr:N-acetyltransferase [Acidimicrobiia bacterium]